MKKIIVSMLIFVFMLSVVSATSGSIWTTRESCDTPQNENHYDIGEDVWIKGENFDEGDYDWNITGQPGQASCDPKEIVANGSYTVDGTGAFCFKAYTVENDDCGEYKASFDKRQDNYHVVPEFGFFVGMLTILSAVAMFFVVRKD